MILSYMKKRMYPLILTVLLTMTDALSQMPLSIIFTQDIDLASRNPEPVFKSKDLPPDLKNKKMFFIQTNALDFMGNIPDDYRFDTTFNKMVAEHFAGYQYPFVEFPDTSITLSYDYFIRNGFRYRLRFYAWCGQKSTTTGNNNPQMILGSTIKFMLCIEDITTEELYFKGGYTMKGLLFNKFFNEIKK